ncbi:hypothetical protein LC612_38375 [Nostoc sp. CHAB 5834]|nr:hypothetical protein [Nostoc sp. CHAB 5834]
MSSGSVYCWGLDSNGQLGNGPGGSSNTPVLSSGMTGSYSTVSASDGTTCAGSVSGAVRCWGNGQQGRLGNGGTSSSQAPVVVSGLSHSVAGLSVGPTSACATDASLRITCWGANSWSLHGSSPSVYTSTSGNRNIDTAGYRSVAVGSFGGCAVQTGGTIKCWGPSPQNGDGGTVGHSTAEYVAAP